jgi:hypothetical protein
MPAIQGQVVVRVQNAAEVWYIGADMSVGFENPDAPSTEPSRRLYSPRQIAAAAFIGSPISAAWLFAQNYAVLGRPRVARRALFYGLLGTGALFGIASVLPAKFPKVALPLASSFAIRELAQRLQGADFKAHLAEGGGSQSNWRVAGVCVAGLVVVLAVAFVFVLLLPT